MSLVAETGQLINQRHIVDLPLNGREAQSLLFLAAGTVNETGNYCLVNCQGGVYPGEEDGSVNGSGPRAVNYQMDGAGHNDTYLNTNLPFPNPDAVQEFILVDLPGRTRSPRSLSGTDAIPAGAAVFLGVP